MDERTDRIIAVAIELAERDGYDAVRLRDLAAQAEVALATVYRRFACKEDILAAALAQQVTLLRDNIDVTELPGDTGRERLEWFFDISTHAVSARPKLAAAMLRTVASGVPELAERVGRYHDTMTELILEVYRGRAADGEASDEDKMFARLLLDVWFAALVGWTGGMHDIGEVVNRVKTALHLLLRGMEA